MSPEVLGVVLLTTPVDVLWDQICERLRGRVNPWHVETYFAPCRLIVDRGDDVLIWAPSAEHRDGIAAMHLEDALAAAVAEVLPGRRVTFAWGDSRRAEAGGK